jgi:hypothetical protein
MTRSSSIKLVSASLLCLIAVAARAAQKPEVASSAPAPYAGSLVSQWTGNVQLQLPGMNLSSPVRGRRLPAGTLVDTREGLMVLVLEDESEILVRPRTRLVLKQPGVGDWNYFELLLGRIRASIQKRTGGAQPFQLGTPSAVIAVRGTRFDVEVNRHSVTEVDVFQGLVEVGALGLPGVSVLVGPGYSTRVGPGSPPEPPIPTDEIRPQTEAPEQAMDAEFRHEKSVGVASLADAEDISEPSQEEVNELENESKDALEANDHDRDDAKPPLLR